MKTILVLVAILLLVSSTAFAADKCISSGLVGSDGVIYAKKATLCGIRGFTNGTDNTSCKVYDNASAASGAVIGFWTTLGSNVSGGDNAPMDGVSADHGLYLDITTNAGSCIIYFIPIGF
jgi:hypothetical protein